MHFKTMSRKTKWMLFKWLRFHNIFTCQHWQLPSDEIVLREASNYAKREFTCRDDVEEFAAHLAKDCPALNTKDNKREYDRRYYIANRERISEASKAYVNKHPEKTKAYRKAYAETHRAENIARVKAWLKNNPGRAHSTRRKHHERFKSLTHRDKQAISEWVKTLRAKRQVRCYWCGRKISGKHIHIDHVIPVSKGGHFTIDNLAASCPPCNHSKSAKPIAKWNSELAMPVLL